MQATANGTATETARTATATATEAATTAASTATQSPQPVVVPVAGPTDVGIALKLIEVVAILFPLLFAAVSLLDRTDQFSDNSSNSAVRYLIGLAFGLYSTGLAAITFILTTGVAIPLAVALLGLGFVYLGLMVLVSNSARELNTPTIGKTDLDRPHAPVFGR